MEAFSALAAPYIADEQALLHTLALAMAASAVPAFVALAILRIPAPYGKYKADSWLYGFPMNGQLAWVLQEAPSFLLAAYLWWSAAAAGGPLAAELTTVSPRSVLLAMYCTHYFNRSFIYPMRIRGGKPTPFVIFLMALAFCVWNGCVRRG
jgi:3-oxo-5-alpha-steroid 4-dehydrogenase 1